MKIVWDVRYVGYLDKGGKDLKNFLDQGWEPFAVTCLGNPKYALVWIRKLIEIDS